MSKAKKLGYKKPYKANVDRMYWKRTAFLPGSRGKGKSRSGRKKVAMA